MHHSLSRSEINVTNMADTNHANPIEQFKDGPHEIIEDKDIQSIWKGE